MFLLGLMLPCLFPGLLSARVLVKSGQPLSVRCHYDPSLRSLVKLWCRQISATECSIVGSTDPSRTPGQVSAWDYMASSYVIFTMTGLGPDDSAVYFCAVQRQDREVVLVGTLEVQVSTGMISNSISTTMTTTVRKTSSRSTIMSIVDKQQMKNYRQLEPHDHEMNTYSELTFSSQLNVYVEILLVFVTVVTIVICVKVIVSFRKANAIYRSKIPLVMSRMTRRKATENVYAPSPRLATGGSDAGQSLMNHASRV
ncbi:CMRF35-like molecule 7 [Megalops cyprinoides]|uniref:CMRF35-like molecule 7 n=1 Tax=Megalops cyprinoides TaxID=118141 RepID=UPI0018645803|nr:CMRF35-like molecule 7 [Megalops cyprinoides]